MMKRLTYLSIFLVILTGLVSCLREELPVIDEVERSNDLPIQLEVSIGEAVGDSAATRSVDKAKRTFSSGDPENDIPADVIHVQSTFKLDDGSELTRYCAMQYTEEGKWLPMGNASFAWPNDAVTGTFTAYYIYGSSGELSDNVSSDGESATRVLFTSIVDGQDPLRADEPDVRYGHTVRLQFKHILTHLTLIELDAGIDDYLIFRIKPETASTENKHQFNNAFEISLDKGADGMSAPKIKFEYKNVPESQFGSMIKSPTEVVRDKVTRIESGQVGFFLEPDYAYNAFDIHYSNYDLYLTYKNSNPNDRDHKLLENNRYTFNVKKSAGVTVQTPPEQRWDESEEFTTVVDAEAFLHAVNTNSEYGENDRETGEYVQILEATTNPVGTLLKRNIRFETPYYHVFPHHEPDPESGMTEPYDFVPSVGADNIFDGGYHYIKGLCCPLFFTNYGVIKNLGLSDVKIGSMDANNMWESSKNYEKQPDDSRNYVKAPYEYLRTGAIATNNFGTVQNMRIKNLSVNVGIHVTESNQEAHNVGGLFGVNNSSGYVEKIYLSGKIEVTVQNFPGTPSIPEVNIGGLAGQNLGTMIEIEQLVDNRETLTEKPQPVNIVVNNLLNGGSGAYYIGGLVGNNTGKLSEVSLPTTADKNYAITIDSSKSRGVLSDIGGIAGKADSSLDNEISSCLIGSGKVTAGSTAKYEYIDPYSYTGGIVGVLSERTHVFNCTSFCSVIGFTGTDNDRVAKASGGAFGNIKAIMQSEDGSIVPGKMTSIAAFGEELQGANRGCFVGEAPYGKSWEDDYQNAADVRVFQGVDYIGSHTAPAPVQP